MKKLIIPIALVLTFLFSSCHDDSIYIDPSGGIVTETRDIRNFDGVRVNGNFEVHLIDDNRYKVVVEGDDSVIDYLDSYVSDGVLVLQTRNGYSNRGNRIRIWVYAPDVYEVELNGSGTVVTDNIHNFGDYLDVKLNGSGDIRLRGDAKTVEVENTGSGDIRLIGNGRRITAHTTGSGDIDALDFVVDEAEAKTWGSGDIFLNIWRYLFAEINGSGDIIYAGNPRVDAYRTGSGTFRRR
jgi:Putative auto-transporter adhesin, head GIN domain